MNNYYCMDTHWVDKQAPLNPPFFYFFIFNFENNQFWKDPTLFQKQNKNVKSTIYLFVLVLLMQPNLWNTHTKISGKYLKTIWTELIYVCTICHLRHYHNGAIFLPTAWRPDTKVQPQTETMHCFLLAPQRTKGTASPKITHSEAAQAGEDMPP